MADFTVFYSWQSDLPRRKSRDVIHDALVLAISDLSLSVDVSDSPRIDHDTKDISGAPEIAATIFNKIDNCGIFVADLTFIGKSEREGRPAKLLPNPNVLLELGYASAKIGWDRIILVMNSYYGAPDELIFDLRHRRHPIIFSRGDDPQISFNDTIKSLSNDIRYALTYAMQAEHTAVENVIGQLDSHSLVWIQSVKQDGFSVPERTTMGEILGHQRIDDALIRLIQLKLLRCDVNASEGLHGYHWTYLGRLVKRRLGVLPSVTE